MTYTWTVDLESTLSKRVDFFTGIIRNYPLFETNFKIKFFTLIFKQKGVRVAKPAERIPPPHMSDYASHAVAVGCVCSPISPEKSCKTTKSAEPGLACNCVRSSEYRFGFKSSHQFRIGTCHACKIHLPLQTALARHIWLINVLHVFVIDSQ